MTMREKVVDYTIVAALITAAMAAVIRYAISDLHDAVGAQTEAVVSQLAKTQARVDEIEGALARLDAAIRRPAFEFSAQGARDADLRARLERLEQHLAEAGRPDVDPAVVNAPADHQTLVDALQDQILGPEGLAKSPSLTDIFSEDRGSSEWGEANITRVSEEHTREPWFHQYGGELTTQCRQTSCKVEWVVPTVEPDDHAFALAEYELMAAATRNTEQIGRVQTERRIEEGRTVVTVYFQRR